MDSVMLSETLTGLELFGTNVTIKTSWPTSDSSSTVHFVWHKGISIAMIMLGFNLFDLLFHYQNDKTVIVISLISIIAVIVWSFRSAKQKCSKLENNTGTVSESGWFGNLGLLFNLQLPSQFWTKCSM